MYYRREIIVTTIFIVLITLYQPVETTSQIPEDFSDNIPYGISLVGADDVWSKTKGSSKIIIAVLDSGVDNTHPDLQGCIWNNTDEDPNNGLDDDNNGYTDDYGGWDFINQSNDPFSPIEGGSVPLRNHGTHVTGTIAARMNNYGVVGVAPNITIMPLRILNKSDLNPDYVVAEAIKYAADNGARIISMSINIIKDEITNYQLVEEAINYAYNKKGVLLVAAAGNDWGGPVGRPANNTNVIAVGAINSNKDLAPFSNKGPNLEVVAPGVDVYSTGFEVDNRLFYTAGGTSMATPHVAGALALILSYKPTLTNIEAREILRNTTEDLGDPGRDDEFGFGLINVSRAINDIVQQNSNTTTTSQMTSNPTDLTTTPSNSSDSTTSTTTMLVTPGWSIIFTSFCIIIILFFRKGKIRQL